MSWPAEEKREAARTPYVRPVSYMAMDQLNHASSGVVVQGEIFDLGNGGVRIRTGARALQEGTMVWARIPLSEPPITVPVLSRVQWVRKEGREVYEIGLQFVL